MSHISALATRYLSDGQNNTDIGNDVWEALRGEAFRAIANEKALRGFINTAVLAHEDFSSALAALLARKLGGPHISAERLEDLVRTASADDPELIRSGVADLMGVLTRDPAAGSYLGPFLYYKGYHALQWQRISHWLWQRRSKELAYFLQNRCSEVFAVDIHPAVPIGRGGSCLVITAGPAGRLPSRNWVRSHLANPWVFCGRKITEVRKARSSSRVTPRVSWPLYA